MDIVDKLVRGGKKVADGEPAVLDHLSDSMTENDELVRSTQRGQQYGISYSKWRSTIEGKIRSGLESIQRRLSELLP